MSTVSESKPWCAMTSAVKAVGIDSHPLTAVSPRFHIVLRRFSRTVCSPFGRIRPGHCTAPRWHSSCGERRRGGPPRRSVMKALTIISLVAAALVALTGPAAAQIQLVNEADREFVSKAATGGTAEVELGRVATQRAVRPSVRSFAERMVADHGRANAELAALARRKGLDVPTALEPSQQAMRDRLSGLSGPDFDRAYMSEIVRDHTEDIALFERAAEISSDPDLKAWATRSLPMLRDHLALARQVNSEVVLGPVPAPAALPAALIIPWCQGAYAPAAGSNFGSCPPAVHRGAGRHRPALHPRARGGAAPDAAAALARLAGLDRRIPAAGPDVDRSGALRRRSG